MQRADAFGRALEVRRQLGYANVSYHLHVDRPADLQEATEALIEAATPIRPLRDAHTYAGFGHLTGYGACYYTYQWSLVIARDLLSAFGDDLADPEVALRYRTEILERGGSRDAADMVRVVPRPAVRLRRVPGVARRGVVLASRAIHLQADAAAGPLP